MRDALALGAGGRLHHQRDGELAAGLEPRLGCIVDQRIEAEHQEVHVRDADQRAHAGRGCAGAATPIIAFSATGVSRTRAAPKASNSPANSLYEPPKRPTSCPSTSTDRVALHLLAQRAGDRLAE